MTDEAAEPTSVAAPLAEPPAGLIVTPGASADRDHPTLVAIEAGLPELAVERLTLGTTSIGRAATLIADAAEALADRLGVGTERIALGGRSFGGRAASVAVADGLAAAALVLLSYPLHPPGRPDRLRTDHFDRIAVPVLLVSGRRDPFGSPEELAAATPAIAGPVTTVLIPGNHSPKGQDATIVGLIRSFLAVTG